jgi:EAL domain-containing protein (putative c-di-GMP-specific phosphodiesterase class I)
LEVTAHILLADGNDSMRRTVCRLLAAVGHRVEAVADAGAARDWMDAHRVDVLIVSDELGDDAAAGLLSWSREEHPEVMRLLLARGRLHAEAGPAALGLAQRVLRRPFQAEQLERELEALHEAGLLVRRAVGRAHDVEFHSAMLQQCLDGRLFFLALQAIVATRSRQLVAVELLLRSRHETLDTPARILDSAERCGREADLGRRVNELVVAWMPRIPPSVDVFVNTHPAQFAGPHALDAFACLEPFAGRIVLEVTERAPLSDYAGAEEALRELGRRGFRIAVDDLGSGYNSLSVLVEFNPAFIKADMSIVRNADREPRKQRLLQLLANFASATGSELVAEGVETAEEAAVTEQCGVDLIQGFHIGRPAPMWPPPLQP